MAGDDVDIRIRASDAQAVAAFRRLKREATHSLGSLSALATAAVPVMATLGAASVKTAGSAVGATGGMVAFGLAVAGQIPHLSKASDAQKKYREAVQQNGRGSKEAAEAQLQLSNSLASMPAATARAAVGLRTMKDTFRAWSDDLAGFTMTPVEKTFTVLSEVIPKLTPMARGASDQLDRLVTVAGGAVASPGFDALSERMGEFTTRSLDKAIDGLLHLSRALSEGEASGPIKAFMDYAEKNGPAVEEALSALGGAVTTLASAAADAGPGMLTLVTAAADLVAALPPELVTVLMQTAVALKLVTLAGAGASAAAAGIAALGTRIGVMRGAAIAAGGGLASLRAAFLALGVASRASIVVAAIAGVTVAFSKLGNIGREAPPNVDKLTQSLGQLGLKGKVSGEAARLFGKDLDGLYESVRNITDPSTADNVQNALVKIFSLGFADSTPSKEARKNLDSIDEGLTNLVKNGKADVAAAAFKRLKSEYAAGGKDVSEFTNQMDGYKSALADVKFEEDLAAEAMGVFGEAARNTSATLEAQKGAADGLRASILALNEVNRSAYDAQIGFEESLDKLTASFKKHGDTLNLDTEAGRANGQAMSEAAKAQDEFIATGLAAGESLGSMTKKSEELRETMMRLATDAFDGNKAKATEYVNTLLGAPGEIKTIVKLEREEAIAGLESVRAAIRETPDAHEVTVSTLNGAAIAALESVGLKTKQLPDGKTAVFTANGQALGSIGAVSTALNNLDGNTANTYVNTTYTKTYRSFRQGERDFTNKSALGGRLRRYATGDQVQMAPTGLISGPGTGTSDSIFAMFASGATGLISDTEFVVNARSTRKYLPLLEAINSDRLKIPGFAKGGMPQGMKDARNDLRDQFGISHFGQRAGYGRTPFEKALGAPSDLKSLVSALNAARSDIKRATSGGTESRLLRLLNSAGSGLIKYEKNLTKVNASLEKAKDKLDSLKSSASQLASSVKSGVLSAANITRGVRGDKPVTVRSIMGGLVESRDQATAFADALKQLKARGVEKSLIKQVAEAGIEGGGLETAGALLRASSSEVASLNDLQKQITAAAGSAGKTSADAFYGAAIKAQESLIKSLGKQQDKLERAMDRLAKSLEKAIKRAIGGKAAGGIIGAAAGGGPRGGLTWVGEQGPELVRLPYGSMVHSNPDSRRMAAAGSGGGAPVVVNLSIGGRDFGQLWIDTGRKQVKAYGGLQAALVTR
ncbi:phage tail protein [Streptomyces caniscabiei]|uniref:phage tail protein n=1 Tax=Streptomyces caniscabiei TaxID=2746961 RepID=UPI0029BF25AB|nr:phage tail protein [Streptomyces caniscabiei]MDX3515874.1 phage tail protein [Streptomyces caniscabiei]MDX3725054.1 phage tail protein [Streptomyces caniscabiei]